MAYGFSRVKTSPGFIDARAFVHVSVPLGGKQTAQGSAVQIGNGIILTAAHVLYENNGDKSGKFFDLTPGLSTDVEGSAKSVSFKGTWWTQNIGGFGTRETYADIALSYGNGALAGAQDIKPNFLIYANPDQAHGKMKVIGYPGKAGYSGKDLIESSGTLLPHYFKEFGLKGVSGQGEVWKGVWGLNVTHGFSGSGAWLKSDPDGDGKSDWFLSGILSAGSLRGVDQVGHGHVASLSTVYWDIARTLRQKNKDADDFGTHTLIASSEGGKMVGTFFNEHIIGGKRDDKLRGAAGDDVLEGNNGKDVLQGDSGKDTLNGGRKSDVLQGGGGSDTFVFEKGKGSKGFGHDTITDFEVGAPSTKLLDFESGWTSTGSAGNEIFHVSQYAGYTWENLLIAKATSPSLVGTGFPSTLTSGEWVASNSGNKPLALIGTDITIVSAVIGYAWGSNDQAVIRGYRNDAVVAEKTVPGISSTTKTTVQFDTTEFSNLDKVTVAIGGTNLVLEDLMLTGSGKTQNDKILMDGYSDKKIQKVLKNATDTSKGAVLDFGDGDTITFAGLKASELSFDLFV